MEIIKIFQNMFKFYKNIQRLFVAFLILAMWQLEAHFLMDVFLFAWANKCNVGGQNVSINHFQLTLPYHAFILLICENMEKNNEIYFCPHFVLSCNQKSALFTFLKWLRKEMFYRSALHMNISVNLSFLTDSVSTFLE